MSTSSAQRASNESSNYSQYSTFYIAGRLYGIDVVRVQEVVRPMKITPVPRSPKYVSGLINLRGQVATAIGVRELFGLDEGKNDEQMNVVCKIGSNLVSLLVDEIGDVVEVHKDNFERTPQTIPQSIKQYMNGVCKTPESLLSIIDIDQLTNKMGE